MGWMILTIMMIVLLFVIICFDLLSLVLQDFTVVNNSYSDC